MKHTFISLLTRLWHMADMVAFLVVICGSVFVKIYRKMNEGVPILAKTIIYESVMSFLVALTVWALMDKLFNVDPFITYMTCAWAGIMSQKFEDKIEQVFDKIFQKFMDFLEDHPKPKK